MHHIVLLIDTSQSSTRNRLVESAKDILKDVFPRKAFEISIVTIGNTPSVLIGRERYNPKVLDLIANGYGLSNLGLALNKCYTLISSNKKASSILYVGDGLSTDDYNPIQIKPPSNIYSHIALLLTRRPIQTSLLQRFDRYTSNEDDINRLQDRLNHIIEK